MLLESNESRSWQQGSYTEAALLRAQDTSLSFRVQPPDDFADTPGGKTQRKWGTEELQLTGKLLLMDGEKTMNILSPARPSSLLHVDLDTGAGGTLAE